MPKAATQPENSTLYRSEPVTIEFESVEIDSILELPAHANKRDNTDHLSTQEGHHAIFWR